MKSYFILFVLPIFFSTNQFIQVRHEPINMVVVNSLIEDKVSQRDTDWLKLIEVRGAKINTNKCYAKLIDLAYKLGFPLEFTLVDKSVKKIRMLKDGVKKQYLSSFSSIVYYHRDSLIGNRTEQQLFEKCCANSFKHYLNLNFPLLKFDEFKLGCEARAVIIANYLKKIGRVNHYKLFLFGKIKLATKNAHYVWTNHVLNIVPIVKQNHCILYVFDPFILEGIVELNDFFKLLKKSGSGVFNYRITDANVFVCLKHLPIGIIDHQQYYTKIILEKLYLP